MMSNASIFRRYAKVEDAMLRGSMPKTNLIELSAAQNTDARAVVSTRTGSRLVKVVPTLTATIADRMVQ